MSALMSSLEQGSASGFTEGAISGKEGQSPSEGDFLIVAPGELPGSPDHLRSFLRAGLYDVVHQHRKPWYDRHDPLLRQITLNDHSTDHVDQVTYMAVKIGEAFPEKIKPNQLEAVAVGGMVHDVAFMHAAEAWGETMLEGLKAGNVQPPDGQTVEEFSESVQSLMDGLEFLKMDAPADAVLEWKKVPPPTHPVFGKKELDPHTHHGMAVLHQWLETPSFNRHFQHWGDEEQRISKFTVLHHSNGSDYTPAHVELPVKLVRMADKLHNTELRSKHLLNESTLKDARNVHQFVPASIEDMSVSVNKEIKRLFITYHVNPSKVENTMRQWDDSFRYDKARFLAEHEKAYGDKSMRYAAEVVASLFAEGDALHDPDARLGIRFQFPDGEIVENTYESYFARTA